MGQDLKQWESSFARERGVSKQRHDDVLTLDGNFSAVGKIFSLSAFARSHRSSLSFREVRILRKRRRRKRIFPEEERSEICAGSSFSHHLCLPLFIIFFRHCALIFLLPMRLFFPARSFFSAPFSPCWRVSFKSLFLFSLSNCGANKDREMVVLSLKNQENGDFSPPHIYPGVCPVLKSNVYFDLCTYKIISEQSQKWIFRDEVLSNKPCKIESGMLSW